MAIYQPSENDRTLPHPSKLKSCSESLSHMTLILHIDSGINWVIFLLLLETQITVKVGSTALEYPAFMFLLGPNVNLWL